MAEAARNRLDRPVDPGRDHVLGPPQRRDHAGRVRQLRLPLLPRRQRAHRRGARRARRPAALRLPPQAADRQRHRPARGRARRARAGRRERSGARTSDADDALGDADRGGPRRWSRPTSASPPTRRAPAGGRARARRGRRAERQGERRAGHADLLHQRPALRRRLGRELVHATRCSARSATGSAPPRSTSPAGRPRPACCCSSRRVLAIAPHQLAARPGLRGASGTHEAGHRRRRASSFRLSLLHWVNDGAPDGLLPGGRARDQARVHRRPPRQPRGRGAADRGGARRHGWRRR